GNLLPDCRYLYSVSVDCDSNSQSAVFTDCFVGDCCTWNTIQVHFHQPFPETFFGRLSGHGMACTTGYGRYAAVLKCSIFNLSDHWWLSIHCRCIVLRFKKSKIYPRYLAHFCIDRRRITFSVYLSLRDLIISFLHFSDPERVETRRLQLFF